MRLNYYLFAGSLCFLLLSGACGMPDKQETVQLESKAGYRLALEKANGAIAFFGKDENLLADVREPLFKVRFLNLDGSFSLYDANDAGKCSFFLKSGKLVFQYEDFPDRPFSVRIGVRADKKDSLFHFSMAVDTKDQVEWMQYPCLTVKETASEDEGILWPYNEGAFFRDASKHAYIEPEYPSQGNYAMYPGMVCTPFLAQVKQGDGLYFGAHDPARQTRQVDFQKTENGIRLVLKLYPGAKKGSVTTADETVLGGFKGDWHAAADIYRRHFDSHHEGSVQLEDNKALPDWYFDPFVVLTYCVRGHHDMDEMTPNKLFPYTNALPLMEAFTEQTGAPVMALLMHWEGTAPWAPPYVWPPYGGEEALKAFVDGMHRIGGRVGVYCSGMGWTQKSNLLDYGGAEAFAEKHLEKEMCLAPNGSLPLSRICTGQRSGYDLCPSRDFTKETLAGEMRKIRASGIDYIQMMDQNHGGTPYMCYAKEHGHASVPGTWESTEAASLYGRILRENPGLVLGCESAASEPFIPFLLFSDNRCGLDFNGGEPVPLYAYIYHEYITNFMGNNVCGDGIIDCRRTPDIFQYRLAYSFLAGDILTVVINDEGDIQWAWGQRDFSPDYRPDREAALSMIRTLTAWRKAFPEFLQLGRAIHPMTVQCGKSIIHTQAGPVEVPSVLTASYASGDHRMHFFVNWKNESMTVQSPTLQGKMYLRGPEQEKSRCNGGKIVLPPRSVVAVFPD